MRADTRLGQPAGPGCSARLGCGGDMLCLHWDSRDNRSWCPVTTCWPPRLGGTSMGGPTCPPPGVCTAGDIQCGSWQPADAGRRLGMARPAGLRGGDVPLPPRTWPVDPLAPRGWAFPAHPSALSQPQRLEDTVPPCGPPQPSAGLPARPGHLKPGVPPCSRAWLPGPQVPLRAGGRLGGGGPSLWVPVLNKRGTRGKWVRTTRPEC